MKKKITFQRHFSRFIDFLITLFAKKIFSLIHYLNWKYFSKSLCLNIKMDFDTNKIQKMLWKWLIILQLKKKKCIYYLYIFEQQVVVLLGVQSFRIISAGSESFYLQPESFDRWKSDFWPYRRAFSFLPYPTLWKSNTQPPLASLHFHPSSKEQKNRSVHYYPVGKFLFILRVGTGDESSVKAPPCTGTHTLSFL